MVTISELNIQIKTINISLNEYKNSGNGNSGRKDSSLIKKLKEELKFVQKNFDEQEEELDEKILQIEK